MDNYHKRLKRKIKTLHKIIVDAKLVIEDIQNEKCKHPETYQGRYEWAPAHGFDNATICSICGKLLKPTWKDITWGTDNQEENK